jgi:hypothetical protein
MLSMGQLMTAIRDLRTKVGLAKMNIRFSDNHDKKFDMAIQLIDVVEKELERIED